MLRNIGTVCDTPHILGKEERVVGLFGVIQEHGSSVAGSA
jgi:hypothetical protein